jgi:hypothetical protein
MSRNYEQTQDDLLNMYIRQYYQIRSHIESLNDMLDEININIINITNNNLIRNRVNRTHTLNNRRQNTFVSYDYNNPIRHNLYNDTTSTINQNRNTRRSRNSNSMTNFYRQILDLFNESVPIIPTQHQIDVATRLVKYSDIIDPLSECCPIALERFQDDEIVRQIHYCNHIFCQSSFNEWFRSNVRCPVCRYDIRLYTNDASNSNNNTNNTNTNNTNTTNNNNNTNNATNTNTNTNNNTNNRSNNNRTNNNRTNNNNNEANISSEPDYNNILSSLSSRIFQELLNSSNSESISYDASNNMIFFETIFTPNNRYNNI